MSLRAEQSKLNKIFFLFMALGGATPIAIYAFSQLFSLIDEVHTLFIFIKTIFSWVYTLGRYQEIALISSAFGLILSLTSTFYFFKYLHSVIDKLKEANDRLLYLSMLFFVMVVLSLVFLVPPYARVGVGAPADSLASVVLWCAVAVPVRGLFIAILLRSICSLFYGNK